MIDCFIKEPCCPAPRFSIRMVINFSLSKLNDAVADDDDDDDYDVLYSVSSICRVIESSDVNPNLVVEPNATKKAQRLARGTPGKF